MLQASSNGRYGSSTKERFLSQITKTKQTTYINITFIYSFSLEDLREYLFMLLHPRVFHSLTILCKIHTACLTVYISHGHSEVTYKRSHVSHAKYGVCTHMTCSSGVAWMVSARVTGTPPATGTPRSRAPPQHKRPAVLCCPPPI